MLADTGYGARHWSFMKIPIPAGIARAVNAGLALLLASSSCAREPAPDLPVQRSVLAERTYLLSAPEGNLVLYTGPASVLIAGVQSPTLVQAALREMGPRGDRRLYVIAVAADSAPQYGDGGWGRRGAVTIAHEKLRTRMVQAIGKDSGTVQPAMVGYSQVIQVYIPGVAAHAVAQAPGISDSDANIHFHSSKVLMLANMFTADGYPAIDTTSGGDFLGLLGVTKWFADNFKDEDVVIPARGPALRGRDLKNYVEMLQSVRDRVGPLVTEGRTVPEIIAAKPLADLEERWGRGPVSTAAFLAAVVRSLRSQPRPG